MQSQSPSRGWVWSQPYVLQLWRGDSSLWSMSYIVSLFVFTGCAAAYTPPPLTTQHPAHPEAPAAPALPPSKTLAYGPSDIPAPQPASFMAQRETPPGGHGAHPSAQRASKRSWVRGR